MRGSLCKASNVRLIIQGPLNKALITGSLYKLYKALYMRPHCVNPRRLLQGLLYKIPYTRSPTQGPLYKVPYARPLIQSPLKLLIQGTLSCSKGTLPYLKIDGKKFVEVR
jgi:hypothetical protein